MNTFLAIQGKQGRYRCYTAVLTLRQLVDLLPPPDQKVAPERRAQRALQESRAHTIADYIGQNLDYALPPLTVSVSTLTFEGGVLTIPEDATLFCNDGQHRRRAIEIAIEEHPQLAFDTVTVVFYEDADLASMQQRFADLNSAQPAARSVKLLYDLRNASKGRIAALVAPFAGLVEMQAANAVPGSDKIWTLSGIDKTPSIDKTEFWMELLALWAPEIADKTAPARKRLIWAHNVGLQGIGFVAEKISAAEVARLVDWRRSNPEWTGRAQRGSKMLAPRKNAVLIANLLLQKAGLPLPPQFQKIEDAFKAESLPPVIPTMTVPVLAVATSPAIIAPTHKLDLGDWVRFYASGPFAYGDVPSFAGISFGRTSAMMAALLDPRVVFCFENTGKEDERTLEFGARLQDALQREIAWLEWRPPRRKGAPPKEFGFEIVTYQTATRGMSLMRDMLRALADYRATKGLGPVVPYHAQRTCTAYLKHRVQRAYMQSLGIGIGDDQIQYIGLRVDEPDRLSNLRAAETSARSYLTPLADANIAKADVMSLWSHQSFDLELPNEWDGNCNKCFLKDDAHLSRKMGDDPGDAQEWIDLQHEFPGFGGKQKHSYAQLLSERPTRLMIESSPWMTGDSVSAASSWWW